jgi:RHS repeat-associated protein
MKRALALLFVQLVAGGAFADRPAAPLPKPPAGMGTYVMVLWPPGTPLPGSQGVVKDLPEPDVAKLGGKLHHSKDNRRIITLPLAAVAQLRRNEAVVYLQRLWMGEPLEGWDERAPSSIMRKTATEADTNLLWGPKAYTYDGTGNIKQIGTDSFVYDSAGRLIQSTVSAKTEKFKYDSFGNLIEKQVTGANANAIPVDGASNRMIGVPYDAAGNALTGNDGRRPYHYDSFNMLARVEPILGNDRRMIYDANDERMGMVIVGDSLSRWTIRDFEGRIIREFKADNLLYWMWELDEFYDEDALLGGESQPWSYSDSFVYGGKRHYHLDHLGSVRMVTDNSGYSISEHDYYPFGTTMTRTYQEQLNWGDPHIDANRFAGHWRDFLGQLNADNTEYIDYMHARYYDPNVGRFTSVDPLMDVQKAAFEPQRWNRYAYVLDNPIRNRDPDGRETNPVTGESFIEDGQIRINSSNPRIGFYGQTRSKNNWKGGEHTGVDISARSGTALVAPIGGTVIVLKNNPKGGNVIFIEKKEGGHTVRIGMAHMTAITVKDGDTVKEGQAVGTSGTTGNAHGLPAAEEHVHLSVKVDGEYTDPQTHFLAHPKPRPAGACIDGKPGCR